jgi:hypothetical protein
VQWLNYGQCHLGQDLYLNQTPSEHPRSMGNPHYNSGQSMPTAIRNAARTTATNINVAPVANYPSIHIGCVGYNVVKDPIVWVR